MSESHVESSSTAEVALKKAPLDEVMMAMDVVDTLRHRQNLVARELASDERERRLIARLKEIYRNQGIDVPEHILAEGVRALEEDRFVYRPPKPGLRVALAKMYIERGRWGKRAAAVAAVVIVLVFGNWFFFERPQSNRLEAAVVEVNEHINGNEEAINQLAQRIASARDSLAKAVSVAPDSVRSVVLARQSVVNQSLNNAEARVDAARNVGLEPNITVDDYEDIARRLNEQLSNQTQFIEEANRVVHEAENGVAEIGNLAVVGDKTALALADIERNHSDSQILQVATRIVGRIQTALSRGDSSAAQEQLALLTSLNTLPAALDSEYAAVAGMSEQDEAAAKAKQLGDNGVRALRNGDVRAANAALDELRNLKDQLEQEYTIRVVSRPNEMSAVWREDTAGRGVKNYYLIVEAIGDDGEAMTMPITSEEDQSTVNTKIWGVRVSEDVYNYVYDDKSSDGIVDDNVVAVKKRGHLRPAYEIPGHDPDTAPGAITRW